jgi:hypothetical protein
MPDSADDPHIPQKNETAAKDEILAKIKEMSVAEFIRFLWRLYCYPLSLEESAPASLSVPTSACVPVCGDSRALQMLSVRSGRI